MLDEKTIKKMKKCSRAVQDWHSHSPKDSETYKLFIKIEILLSIILEDVEDWMSESEVRNYEFTESGLDWLYWLPLDLKAKKEIIKDFEETYIREEKDAK